MRELLQVTLDGAGQFRAPQGSGIRRIGRFVPRHEADPTLTVLRKTLVFVPHQEAEDPQTPAMDGFDGLGGSAEVQEVPDTTNGGTE